METIRHLLRCFLMGASLGELALPLVVDPPAPREPVVAPAVPDCFVPCCVISVHDCDTLRADVLLPWGVTLRDQSIRAAGFDAWEVTTIRETSNSTVNVTPEEIARGKAATIEFRKLLETGTLYLSPVGTRKGSERRMPATRSATG